MKITQWTALELGKRIRNREISVTEAALAQLEEIEKKEGICHAYITMEKERVLQQAAVLERELREGRYSDSPLAGVPMALKDNISTKGLRTTCGSRMLEHYVPTYDAEVVTRLKKGGALILGKLNMDEFAMGSTTETSFFGPTKNPVDPSRIPGGSSGGSAAAVAGGEAFYTLGSDTGGSIRQPASHCGVVGLKPTYGLVSRYGLVAYASSLDQIGPVTRDVSDLAEVLELIAGQDEKDSTSLHKPDLHYRDSLIPGVGGLHIGIARQYFEEGLDPEVEKAVLSGARTLKEAGAELMEVDLPMTPYALPSYYVIACAEASSNLSRYDGVRYGYRTAAYDNLETLYLRSRTEGFGEEVKRRLMIGSFALSAGYYDAYYDKALRIRALIHQDFDEAFSKCDVILGPVAPSTAPGFSEDIADPVKLYLRDIYTVAVNLAGLPALSIPCGFDQKGLPIGMQLIGPRFSEGRLIQTAYTYEQCTKHTEGRNRDETV